MGSFEDIEERFEYAMKRRALTHKGAYTQAILAERVGAVVGQSFVQSTAAGWLRGVIPKDRETMLAIAAELGFDPGWLYFHPDSVAPMDAKAADADLRKPAAQRPELPMDKVQTKKPPEGGRKRA